MSPEDEARLSYYTDIEDANASGDISTVRHKETGVLYVKKLRTLYDLDLYSTLKQLNIPGIPGIIELVPDGDRLLIIEEYASGITIEKYLESHGNFSAEDAIHVLLELCKVLERLHALTPPIIHRDIKPANVLVTSSLNVTLIDFDAARLYDETKSRDTVLMGTPEYAAPEQFGFGQSTVQTDIYGLGMLLKTMLTGADEKRKSSSESEGDAGCKKDSPEPSAAQDADALGFGRSNSNPSDAKNSFCDSELAHIITKCTYLDQEKRYASVKDLAAALRSVKDTPLKKARKLKLPGFRTRRPWKMIVATLSYLTIFWLSATLTVEGTTSPGPLAVYRLATLAMTLGTVFILFDYRGVSSILPFSSGTNLPLKILGRLFAVALLFAAIVLFLIMALSVIPS